MQKMGMDDTDKKEGGLDTDTGTTAIRIYPSSPLEESLARNGNNGNNGGGGGSGSGGGDEQSQSLLPPAPPSYDQATNAAPTVTAAATAGAAPVGGGAHVVVITPGAPIIYGPEPVDIQCPYCQNFTRTRLRFKPTSRTHLIALLLCLFQLYCFVCLPYCIGSCMNVAHYCGMCDRYLGTYARS